MLSAFTDAPNPRHILQDNNNDDFDFLRSPPLSLPNVDLNLRAGVSHSFDYLLVVPNNLKAISDSYNEIFKNSVESIGTISIEYADDQNGSTEEEDEEEYDEQEQLYNTSPFSTSLKYKSDPTTIEILSVKLPSSQKRLVYITIPVFKNTIIYQLVSRKLMESLAPQLVIAIGTSAINNGETINKLLSGHTHAAFAGISTAYLNQVPAALPPHFATGACGALVAAASTVGRPAVSLLADAEGAFAEDMERVDPAAVEDCFAVVCDMLQLGQHRLKARTSAAANLYL